MCAGFRVYDGQEDNKNETYTGVMRECLYAQKLALQEDFPYPSSVCLMWGHKAPKKLAQTVQATFGTQDDVLTAVSGKASPFVSCHVDDVVVVKWSDTAHIIGKLVFLCKISGACWACITVWTKLPQMHMYDCSGDNYLVPLSHVVDTCVYAVRDAVAFVVPPRAVRA